MQAISSALETALAQSTVKPKSKAIMHLSNNMSFAPVASATPNGHNPNIFTVVDGIEEPSMKFATLDSGCKLDDGWRLLPEKPEQGYIQYPWVSEVTSNQFGQFASAQQITVEYPHGVNANKIVFVTDPFGQNGEGQVRVMDVFVRPTATGLWTRVAFHLNPQSYRLELYLQDDVLQCWSPTYNVDNITEIDGIRVEVFEIISDNRRGRRLNVFELDAQLEVDVSDYIISWNVQKNRDISSNTVSIIGTSAAATMSLVLANHDNRFNNNSSDSPYQGMLQLNTRFDISLGFDIGGGVFEYIPQGTFFADEWTISSDTAITSVNCRDFSKVIQDRTMPPVVYQGVTLSEAIQDIVEIGGITDYRIDTSRLMLEDLATGATTDLLGPDDLILKQRNNLIWSDEQTVWEFLTQIAISDLGVFYFDESGVFQYVIKEALTEPDEDVVVEIADTDRIIDADFRSELIANSINVSYIHPELSEDTVGLWEADDPTILGATSLVSSIGIGDTSIHVGTVQDWPDKGFFIIDDEIIEYKRRTDVSFEECERGVLNTVPAEHSAEQQLNWVADRHKWEIVGGELRATGSTSQWGFLRTQREFADNYSFSGDYRVVSSPWKFAIAVKMKNFGTYYMFVIHCFPEPGQNGGSDAKEAYQLFRVQNGNMKKIASTNKNKSFIEHSNQFRVELDDQDLILWINGVQTLKHNDKDAPEGLQNNRGFVGLGHIGSGPNYFDNATVVSGGQNTTGERTLFRDGFGKAIYEIRKFEAEFDEAPATSVNWWINNEEEFKVLKFDPEPFGAEIYVQNLKDGLSVLAGPIPEKAFEGINNFFILYGHAVEQVDEQDLENEDKDSIRRNGRKEYNITLPWVQSRTHAKKLLDYLVQVYKEPIEFIDTNVFALPQIQLGDIARLTYPRLGFTDTDFHVTQISLEVGDNVFNQKLTVRTKIITNPESSLGSGILCSTIEPPSSFYTTDNTNFVPEFAHKSYTLEYLHRLNSPVTNAGEKVPISILRPSNKKSPWTLKGLLGPSNSALFRDNNMILDDPSSYAAAGTFPVVVFAHTGWLDASVPDASFWTVPYYSDLYFLSKIARMGYVVMSVYYRGSGGFGSEWAEKRDYFHEEVNDIIAAVDWIKGESYVDPAKVVLFGAGRGGTNVLVASHLNPDEVQGFAAFSAAPNIACDIVRWPETTENKKIKQGIFNAFDGSPQVNPAEYVANSPTYHVDDVTKPVFLAHGENDFIFPIKNIYDYKTRMLADNNTITVAAYKNLPHSLLGDDNAREAERVFRTDRWRRLMEFIDGIL